MRFLQIALILTVSASLFAQQLLEAPKFPQSAFFRQWFGREAPRVDLQPPVRLQDFAVGDRLELSLRSYLELVLANNTDIQIQRMSIETFRNGILRSYGRFDPFLNMGFNATRANNPATNVLQGATTVSRLDQPFTSQFNQTFESGTQVRVGFNASKTSTNDSFQTFNPAFSSGFNMGFTQPLMRNRGAYVNRLPIMVARSRYRQGDYSIQDRLLELLRQAEFTYWDVIGARESLKVQEEALNVAGQILKRNQRELELGAISELEIYQPQQVYATQEVAVTQARYRLQQVEDQLRRQIGADLDPAFRGMPITLTETVLPPTDDRPLDKEAHVESAYRMRPDLKATLQSLDIDDLNYKIAKNTLLPDVNLTGNYTSNGRGGTFIPRTTGLGVVAGVPVPGGLYDALDQVFGFNFPTYAMGIQIRLPFRDRATQADLADAVVSKRLNTLRARANEQQIRLDVLNAVTQVENSRASVKLAQVALDFSQKRLEAEQKRYDLGVTTIFFVIQAQQDLVNAQANVVTQSINYRRALITLLRQTGQLLEERGIVIQ
jgi:outer membrane protein TolC